ncbi:MAG: adenylyl-sulfate kinase [Proteobacteria bacterium]|nr:adenylyl-sulfate kinase [Pseudomonadota bacterium]
MSNVPLDGADNLRWHPREVARTAREQITKGRGCTVWLTGFSGSGKSTIAARCEALLVESGRGAYTLDGDNIRHGLNADLGFSPDDRTENVRRVGEVARLMADAGLTVFAPLISPYANGRERIRAQHADADIPFYEVHVATPIEVCEERDTKGLYARARAGEITDFTGINAPYEVPAAPDLAVDTSSMTIDEAARAVLALIA